MSKKVYVCCPGNVVTGGPELLHQFVDALRKNNIDAYIIYRPFNEKFSVPQQYQHYNTPIAKYSDVSPDNSIVVLPEVDTGLAKHFSNAHIVIWWLSVDFYFSYTGNRPVKDFIVDKVNLIRGRRKPINAMKSFSHYAQSEYARGFLLQNGIKAAMLTDYLGSAHLTADINQSDRRREKIIAYNPKKGVLFTNELIATNGDYKFVAIKNMTPQQVRELLLSAMIYIDFGNHPGKDRFPREAAMAGCCIITGRRGSAFNDVDICIPPQYKINEKEKNINEKFRFLVDDIFNDFESRTLDFSQYRKKIQNEPEIFEGQVVGFINKEIYG